MAQDVEHDGNFSQDQLQTNLRFNEGLWGRLTGIGNKDNFTISTHDDVTMVPNDSLELKLDPNGTEAGAQGSTLLCRGEALIGGTKTKVAAFRKAAG